MSSGWLNEEIITINKKLKDLKIKKQALKELMREENEKSPKHDTIDKIHYRHKFRDVEMEIAELKVKKKIKEKIKEIKNRNI